MIRLSSSIFALISTVAFAPSAFALAAADDADQSSEDRRIIIVEGSKEAEGSYKVSNSRSAMRTDTPLIDTPQAVNVISVKQIEDQASNNIGEAIR